MEVAQFFILACRSFVSTLHQELRTQWRAWILCISKESPLNSACGEQRVSKMHLSSRCWVIWRVRMPIRYWTWQEDGGVSKTNERWIGAVPEFRLRSCCSFVQWFVANLFCHWGIVPPGLKVIFAITKRNFFFSFKCPFPNQNWISIYYFKKDIWTAVFYLRRRCTKMWSCVKN